MGAGTSDARADRGWATGERAPSAGCALSLVYIGQSPAYFYQSYQNFRSVLIGK